VREEEEEEEGYTAQPGKVGAPTLGEHSGWAGAPCEPPGDSEGEPYGLEGVRGLEGEP